MSARPESAARLSPEREAETRKHIAELIYPTYGQRDTERTLAIADAVMPAVRAALAAVRAERDQARKALEEIQYLHKDSPMGPCPVCIDADAMVRGDDYTLPYPCPTARLTGAQDFDPPSFRNEEPVR